MSPGRSASGQPVGDGDQQLVADAVPVEVVHELEPVEIGEEDRGPLARPPGPQHRVIQPLEQEDPVGQPGERVVQRALAGSVGGVPEVGPRLRVEQVGGRDVGQRLGRVHRVGVQRPGGVAVEVERAQLRVAMAEREGEHRAQPVARARAARSSGTGSRLAEVRDRDGLAGSVGGEARPFAELGLQLLEPQRRLVRRRDVAGIELRAR